MEDKEKVLAQTEVLFTEKIQTAKNRKQKKRELTQKQNMEKAEKS